MSDNNCDENREVYARQYPGFRISAGGDSLQNGKVEYEMSTDSAQGFVFYENGNQDFVTNGTSKEVVGHSIKGEPGKTSPAKVIDAVNGDIYFRAKNGTIYLEAANIVITGVDGTGGNIHLQASSNIILNGPTVTTQATNAEINASQSATIVAASSAQMFGGSSTSIQAGPDVDNSNFLSKILSWISKYKTYLNM